MNSLWALLLANPNLPALFTLYSGTHTFQISVKTTIKPTSCQFPAPTRICNPQRRYFWRRLLSSRWQAAEVAAAVTGPQAHPVHPGQWACQARQAWRPWLLPRQSLPQPTAALAGFGCSLVWTPTVTARWTAARSKMLSLRATARRERQAPQAPPAAVVPEFPGQQDQQDQQAQQAQTVLSAHLARRARPGRAARPARVG